MSLLNHERLHSGKRKLFYTQVDARWWDFGDRRSGLLARIPRIAPWATTQYW
jgi:hypothetical protein